MEPGDVVRRLASTPLYYLTIYYDSGVLAFSKRRPGK